MQKKSCSNCRKPSFFYAHDFNALRIKNSDEFGRNVSCGLVYEVDGYIVGIAHYRKMPSPLRGKDIGFLEIYLLNQNIEAKKLVKKYLMN